MKINELFPNGEIKNTSSEADGKINIFLGSDQWLILDQASLTVRERMIISLFQKERFKKEPQPTSAWYGYLVLQNGELPIKNLEAVQFIYIRAQPVQKDDVGDWKSLVCDALPNRLASFSAKEEELVLILQQTPYRAVENDLLEMLPVLEFDMGARLSVAIGQLWPFQFKNIWDQLFQAEYQLFNQVLNFSGQSVCWNFSQLIQFNLCHHQSLPPFFLHHLSEMIHSFEQMSETITMLWREGAVLTKTAQKLFIHRNTLQYRLEKFREQTGLNLKNMDDLFLCHLALMHK